MSALTMVRNGLEGRQESNVVR